MSHSLERHPEVNAYLHKICAQVKAKEVHEEIRHELLSHLEELTAERVAQSGMPEEKAMIEALRHMGDPEQVGKQLHTAHKPKPEWGVIALVAGMFLIGLVSMFTLRLSVDGMIDRKLVYGFVGVAVMIGLYFVDYRKLIRYSWVLYGATLLLMAAVHWQSVQVNGVTQWLLLGPFNFNVYAASPYLLLIAIAGMLQRKKPAAQGLREEAVELGKDAVLFMLIPALLYVPAPAFAYLLIYGFGLAVLLLVSGKMKLLITGLSALVLMTVPVLLNGSFDYEWSRLSAFLNPDTHAQTEGYLVLRSVEAIQSGGMWGQGFGIVNDKLPLASSELFYSYLVYNFGWVFGIAVALLAFLFVVRIARMGAKLQDSYAKNLVVGLIAVLGIQLAWNLLMCAGLLPILGLRLPIMNWSSGMVIELAAVGLILSAYRRKDMFGSSYRPQPTKV
ncbi:FtsW/RodA/SpoVE family cell cycle protein [Cohnella herbarum]|uniref:FtsW/RodA/SpoVE family cell cycle protein n=1 Tax=Cohnella herbarum TaxID=2728023 RepID=A0A7Z2VNF3_9BACL|nr:FtsW/RodA/SpoVE family cell cycle protein [Cohnella herbarum]QJD86144.1 FtsW/RodA/SpoVE family cell cycle protein [Cohnella herbarum]